MNTIQFKYVIPQVFASREEQNSDVWQQDIAFEKEKVYLIEAESGKGKSTFCSYLIGYRHDYSGQVLFDDIDARGLKVADWTNIRQQHISMLFQELRLFPELTAMENVLIKNNLTGYKTREEIVSWFEMLGIPDKQDVKIGRMSFGQQQRVALMRSLVQPFDFLVADEPVSHLDDQNATIMGDIMMQEVRRQGAGLIVTSIGKHMDLNYNKVVQL